MFHPRYAVFQEIIARFMRGSPVILTKSTNAGGIKETRREGNEASGRSTGKKINRTADAGTIEKMIRPNLFNAHQGIFPMMP